MPDYQANYWDAAAANSDKHNLRWKVKLTQPRPYVTLVRGLRCRDHF